MILSPRRFALLIGVVTLAASAPSSAADPACLSAYDSSQRLRRSGKLREAEQAALACVDPSCPRVLQKDCMHWLDEIRASMPSLSVSVTDVDGCDVTKATVAVDGEVVATSLDGRALSIDPGVHVLRVELAAGRVSEQRVVMNEGEKARRHVVSFAARGVVCGHATSSGIPAPVAPAPASSEQHGQTPLMTYVLGGVGIAALAVGGGFEIVGFSDRAAFDACRPRCSSESVDDWRTKFIVGDVFIGLGLVSLGIAGYLYFTRPTAMTMSRR